MISHSLYEIKDKEQFLTTGCPKLDSFLRGGLPQKGITQLYGEAGIGKTQLALQLCLSAQIPCKSSNKIGTAYICTESAFPSRRLQDLLQKSPISKKYGVSNEMIFIEHVSDIKDLEDCIFNPNRLQYLLSKHNIKVLIIDSIAAPYRLESNLSEIINRAKSLRKMGYQLQKIAKECEIAVICLNQVTAIIKDFSADSLNEEQPSLGITWASMITNSLYMYKKGNRRYLQTVGSSYLPSKAIEFEILESGVMAKDN